MTANRRAPAAAAATADARWRRCCRMARCSPQRSRKRLPPTTHCCRHGCAGAGCCYVLGATAQSAEPATLGERLTCRSVAAPSRACRHGIRRAVHARLQQPGAAAAHVAPGSPVRAAAVSALGTFEQQRVALLPGSVRGIVASVSGARAAAAAADADADAAGGKRAGKQRRRGRKAASGESTGEAHRAWMQAQCAVTWCRHRKLLRAAALWLCRGLRACTCICCCCACCCRGAC